MNFGELEIQSALAAHNKAWHEIKTEKELRTVGTPTTLSIKVVDKRTLFEMLEENASCIEQTHIGTVNDRYIASAALIEPYEDLPILKVLERRPASSDPTGLDSVDYLVEDIEATFRELIAAGLPVVKESNDVHAWLSLRFGPEDRFEAKFTDHVVLEVAVKELKMTIEKLRSAR